MLLRIRPNNTRLRSLLYRPLIPRDANFRSTSDDRTHIQAGNFRCAVNAHVRLARSSFACVWADHVRKSVVKQTHRHTEKQADKQTVGRNSAIRLCLIGPWLIRNNSAGRRLLCYVRLPRRNMQFSDSARRRRRRFLLLSACRKFLHNNDRESPNSLCLHP